MPQLNYWIDSREMSVALHYYYQREYINAIFVLMQLIEIVFKLPIITSQDVSIVMRLTINRYKDEVLFS